jgi:serine/threonine protein phosphatase 1
MDFEPSPASLPPDQRIYAIGDVHGCADRLAMMHGAIAEDIAARPIPYALVIHIGDYIDRGPDSARVIERLLQPFPVVADSPSPQIVNLIGNHEEMLLMALEDGDRRAAELWLANNGGATLASWGLSWRDGPRAWRARIPPRHLGWLRGLALIYRAGGYVFVHAGVRPGVALEQQQREDMLWIREPFLSGNGVFPSVVVVHGHTPDDAPQVRPHRIGIDTGAVLGGPLTCAVLEGDGVAFLQT